MADDAFFGAWRVRETVFSLSGQPLGEVAQRRAVEALGDGRLRVLQHCEPDAALRDLGHPMVAFGGEHIFTLSRHGAVRRYHGPAVLGGALTIGEGALIGRGVWPRFGWAFTSWSVLVAPDRQITGGRFHRGGAPMATIVGVAAPETANADIATPTLVANGDESASRLDRAPVGGSDDIGPRLGKPRWPGECARRWKGTRCRVDGTGRVMSQDVVWRRYGSAHEWSAPDLSATFTERGDAFALDGTVEGRRFCGFARRFGWMVESEAVIGDDTILESIEVFDEAGGHLVVLQRWLVNQTLQRAEVLRLRPEGGRMSTSGAKKESEWQKRIEGDWHGVPSVFDAEGHHAGHIKVSRASLFEGERVTYTMDTLSDVRGPLRSRFEARDFAFGVRDDGKDRVYMGPDFMGAGRPWGAVVDAHYYSPAWMADLRTMVHVLPDQKTQAYSSLLFEGPTLIAVFNGLYKVGNDYGKNPETTRFIDTFLEHERKVSQNQHVLPFKRAGRWTGELTTYASSGELAGVTRASIDYRPTTLLRANFDVHLSGAFERRLRYERARVGHRHVYEGPDVYGNAIGYGRALYTAQHFHGHALSIEGREFLVDDDYAMSVVWKVRRGGDLAFVLYGLLTFEPGEIVLATAY